MSNRRIDLGTAVRAWRARTGEELDGVVIEIVPPQTFPHTPRASRALDFYARYVLQTDKGLATRTLDQMEIVAI